MLGSAAKLVLFKIEPGGSDFEDHAPVVVSESGITRYIRSEPEWTVDSPGEVYNGIGDPVVPELVSTEISAVAARVVSSEEETDVGVFPDREGCRVAVTSRPRKTPAPSCWRTANHRPR